MTLAALFGSFITLLATSLNQLKWLKTWIASHFAKKGNDSIEWFSKTTSFLLKQEPQQLASHILKTFAQLTASNQAILFQLEREQGYLLKECWNAIPANKTIYIEQDAFIDYVNLVRKPFILNSVAALIPADLQTLAQEWLLVPLFLADQLYAFILLAGSTDSVKMEALSHQAVMAFGQQSALFLKHAEQTQALAVARQFENFNRLTAFTLHDLKNVHAQLKLIQINKEKHQHHPAFMASVYRSIEESAEKIARLLMQGREQKEAALNKNINVVTALQKVVQLTSHHQPVPQLDWQVDTDISIAGDENNFINVLCHLVENAQQATPLDGKVVLSAKLENQSLLISIHDTGCGMDPEFVHVNLYKPFFSTKGEEGMGIGVYEAREYAHAAGGRLMIESLKGIGSTFRLQLPLRPKFLPPVVA